MGYRLIEGNGMLPQVKLGDYKKIRLQGIEKAGWDAHRSDELINALIKSSDLLLPKQMIDYVARQMAEEFAARLSQQGLSIGLYYAVRDMNEEKLLKRLYPAAVRRVAGRLIYEKIAQQEQLQATKQEYEAELKRLAEMYLMSQAEVAMLTAGKEEKVIKEDIAIHKAFEFMKAQVLAAEEEKCL